MACLQEKIRLVPDFPRKGILFRDITTLLQDKDGFKDAVKQLANHYAGEHVDLVAGIEARGFILGAAVAHELGVGFIPLRKKGKLPHKVLKADYALEYGTDSIEMHEDAIKRGEKVLIVDDLLATGGTAGAAVELVRKAGGEIVGLAFLIEMSFLHGRKKLNDLPVFSLIDYKTE